MTTTLRAIALAMLILLATHGSLVAQVPTGTPQESFAGDVHARAGLTCDTCHGATTTGEYRAIKRTEVAPLCAHCHSDAAYMQKFVHDPRVDQYARYQVSLHGKAMAAGETRVATCTDCHGGHGVQAVTDTRSPVHPLRVVATCSRCHADQERMTAFKHNTKAPAQWTTSVHAAALASGDTSAPTCATCHSGHGPTPPGLASLALVCATCHVREGELYNNSPKKRLFESNGRKGCVTCHENHKILKPNDNWVSMKNSEAPCFTCHDDTVKGASEIVGVRDELQRISDGIARAEQVLDRAERVGMLVDDGRAALREAQEAQILARVNVHLFALKPFLPIATQSITAAARAEKTGADALEELQFRRKGLGVATVLILGFLVTLWLKIRRLPPPASDRQPRHGRPASH